MSKPQHTQHCIVWKWASFCTCHQCQGHSVVTTHTLQIMYVKFQVSAWKMWKKTKIFLKTKPNKWKFRQRSKWVIRNWMDEIKKFSNANRSRVWNKINNRIFDHWNWIAKNDDVDIDWVCVRESELLMNIFSMSECVCLCCLDKRCCQIPLLRQIMKECVECGPTNQSDCF